MKECEPFHIVQAAADIVEEAIWQGLMKAKAKGDETQMNLWHQLYIGVVDGSELDYRPEDIPDFRPHGPFGDDPVPGF